MKTNTQNLCELDENAMDSTDRIREKSGNTICIQAGVAHRELSLPIDTPLAGYGKTRSAKGSHDPLMASIMVLNQMDEVIVIASLDVLAVDHLLIEAIQAALDAQNFPARTLIVHAIHTHSAMGGLLETRSGILKQAQYFACKTDEKTIEAVAQSVGAAILDAWNTMKDGRILHVQSGYSLCKGLGSNRTDPSLPGNDALYALQIETDAQKALLVFFACHPTVLNASNVYGSADFYGAARKHLKEAGYDQVLFFNGACGDISTRYTRKASSFDEADRLGSILASAVLGLSWNEQPVKPIEVFEKTYVLQSARPKPVQEAQRRLEASQNHLNELEQASVAGNPLEPLTLRLAAVKRDADQARCIYAISYDGVPKREMNVTFVRWDAQTFVGLPCEIFSSLISPFDSKRVHFVSCTNGYQLYLTDEKAWDDEDYEACCSLFARSQGEQLMDQIQKTMASKKRE